MKNSLKSRARLPRVIWLMAAFFLPSLAFADWFLPYSPVTGTYYTIQWTGSAPSYAPAVVVWALPPGGTNWLGFGSAGVVNGQVNLSAAYNFSSPGLWGLKIESVGTSTPPVTISLTTIYVNSLVADTTPPSTPGTPSASSVTQNSITLTWGASTDNVGVTGYEVFRDGSSASVVSGTAATISGLAASTTYSFQVRARDAAGNWSGLSSIGYASTSAAPPYVYINGWTLPGSPVVGQSYSIHWEGYSYGASYVLLYNKAPGSSTWTLCGGGGGPASGGIFSANGGWTPNTSGTWDFGVGSGGALPNWTSASITVP
jgi:chitodextrinase